MSDRVYGKGAQYRQAIKMLRAMAEIPDHIKDSEICFHAETECLVCGASFKQLISQDVSLGIAFTMGNAFLAIHKMMCGSGPEIAPGNDQGVH